MRPPAPRRAPKPDGAQIAPVLAAHGAPALICPHEHPSVADLAQRFFDAIGAGDVAAVADCYAEDAVIWHNTDGQGQSKAENLATLQNFVARAPVRRYADRRLAVLPDRFVQQHVLICPRADGSERRLDAAIVCEVRDGRITRLDEDFDSAQLAAWRR